MGTSKFKVIIVEPRHNLHIEAPPTLRVADLIERITRRYNLPNYDIRQGVRYIYELSHNATTLDGQSQIGEVVIADENSEATLELRRTTKDSADLVDQGGLARFTLNEIATVEELENTLRDLRHAYEALHASNVVLIQAHSAGPYPDSLRGMHESVLHNLHSNERLLIRGVSINSPGWAEVIGRLNPLETLRRYLKDRQLAKIAVIEAGRQRAKDEKYGNAIEQAKAVLEMESMKTRVAAERARNLLELGYSLQEVRPYVSELIERPLEQLQVRRVAGQISCESVIELDASDISIVEDVDYSIVLPLGRGDSRE